MSNTSASGGYLTPVTQGLPGALTLNQFIQTVLVGISGLQGSLVRPRWQQNPPKMPDIDIDWLTFGVVRSAPDANAYVWIDDAGVNQTQRHEGLEVQCSTYGPNCEDLYAEIRDGFQITQNLEALRAANMGFTTVTEGMHVPDLVNERWTDRFVFSVFLRREIQRAYPILSILSAGGKIHTVLGTEPYLLAWQSPSGGS